MLDLRAAEVLFSCFIIFISLVSTCTGQAGGNCSCNATNSRCDEAGLCRCDPGWDGERCDRCVPTPGCLHGSCLQPWQCSCRPGWAGRFCDKDLSACERRPCLNGATCSLEASGDFSCSCPRGFQGPRCERRAGPCSGRRSPCKNGGLCEDGDGFAAELSCRCLAGFTGRRCETDLDDCRMSPCANGATCLDGVNRFSCACPAGFAGRFCTVNLDDCASRPCQNAGRCLDRAGGFRCICRPGFAGDTCQVPPGAPEPEAPEPEAPEPEAPEPEAGGRSHRGGGPLKVTVSERGGGGGLSEAQLLTLLLLAGVTLLAVVLTAALVLQGHCSRNCGHAHFGSPPTSWRTAERRPQRDPFTAEPEKKKLEAA